MQKNSSNAEELLIDFCELLGEHSGENMADVVWETLVRFGIQDRIMAFVMDNATNNDTLVKGIVNRAAVVGISLNASWIRLRCLPHTIHLAAIKLLEGLGVISDLEAKKARSRSGNYQESATIVVGSEADKLAAAADDNDSEDPVELNPSMSDNILSGVDKVL
ncbi:hypothetical protein C0992_012116 [Termitomyces sp. T32_za158]|nr:hypothetical protein C0992_012116 [Termitomyces sp. T32_za158]